MEKVRASNLFSVEELEFDLDTRGLLLVTGYSEDEGCSNGAGKSTVASKIPLWILYGQVPQGTKGDGVKNGHAKKKKTWGELDLRDTYGTKFTIRRERPAKLTLMQGDKDISAKSAAETQEMIDLLVGRDSKTFMQTCFFGQGRKFAYPELTSAGQKEVLSQILPFDTLEEWEERAAAEAKKAGLALQNISTRLVGEESKVDALGGQRVSLTEKDKNWYRDEVETPKGQILQEIETLEYQDIGIVEEIEALKQKEVERREEHASLFAELAEYPLSEGGAELTAKHEIERINKEFDEVQALLTGQIADHNRWLNHKQNLEGKVRVLTKNMCPTCDQQMEVEAHLQLVEEQDKLGKDIQAASHAIEIYARAEEQSEAQLAELKNDLDPNETILTQAAQIAVEHDHLQALILRVEARSYESEILRLEAASNKPKIEALNLRLKDIANKTNPYTELLSDLDTKLAHASIALRETRAQRGEVEEEYNGLKFWQNAYGKDLKLTVFENAVPYLNSRTAHHLQHLSNSQIHVAFTTVRTLADKSKKEEFGVSVYSDTGGDDYGSLSGGEQKMTNIAIGFALADLAESQVSGAGGFMILDEPFTELSEKNCESVVNYLTGDFGKGKDTILLISNEESLKGLISNREHVIKKNGITSLEEE